MQGKLFFQNELCYRIEIRGLIIKLVYNEFVQSFERVSFLLINNNYYVLRYYKTKSGLRCPLTRRRQII